MDNLLSTGIYYVATSTANTPDGRGGICIVGAANSSTGVQLFVENSGSNSKAYLRTRSFGTWGSWLAV